MCEEIQILLSSEAKHSNHKAVGMQTWNFHCLPGSQSESGVCTCLVGQSIYDFSPQQVPFSLSKNMKDHVSTEEITLLLKSQFSLAPAATVLKIIDRRGKQWERQTEMGQEGL